MKKFTVKNTHSRIYPANQYVTIEKKLRMLKKSKKSFKFIEIFKINEDKCKKLIITKKNRIF